MLGIVCRVEKEQKKRGFVLSTLIIFTRVHSHFIKVDPGVTGDATRYGSVVVAQGQHVN